MRSVVVSLIAASVGLGFARLAGVEGLTVSGWSVLLVCASLSFVINWVAFIPAAFARTEKYYDLIGSVTFLVMIGLASALSAPLDFRGVIVGAMVAIWTTRLGLYLFRRIHASGHGDPRFDKIKTKPARFFQAWTVQALWAVVTASAALVTISAKERVEADIFLVVGAIVWLAAFLIEVISDRQKAAFRADPANEGEFIRTGLWSWSQHPNYFGEVMMWVGIVVIALPILSGWSYLALLSPALILLLLTKVSGINLLQASGERKWGDREDYRAYRKHTSVLIPLPPKL